MTMITSAELEARFERLGTPRAGRDYIRKLRKCGASRTPGSRRGNVVSKYMSRKMNRRIMTESLYAEQAAVLRYDYDLETEEFYPQPPSRVIETVIHPKKTQADGKPVAPYISPVPYTPDFFRITADRFLVEEWKTREDMEELLRKYPHRYQQTENGFRCPEKEEHFAKLGIEFSIHLAEENPPMLVQNIEFLADYCEPDAPQLDPIAWKLIEEILARHHTLSLADLLPSSTSTEEDDEPCITPGEFIGHRLTADHVYKAIADGLVFVDLVHDDLSNHHNTIICQTAAHLEMVRASRPVSHVVDEYLDRNLEEGVEVRHGDAILVVELLSGKSCILRDEHGRHHPWQVDDLAKAVESGSMKLVSKPAINQTVDWASITVPNEAQLLEAQARLNLVRASAFGPVTTTLSNRTLSRYRRAVRDAGPSEHQQLLALVSKKHLRGSRKSKLDATTLGLIADMANADNNPTDRLTADAFREYRQTCILRGIKACSKSSFFKEYNRRKSVERRRGSREAYQQTPAIDYLKRETKIHGVRPFQMVHFDHTKLMIRVPIRLHNGRIRKIRPWLSLAIDAETRAIVGFYLSVHHPSTVSCMMLCRDIVQRYHRMPSMIVVDNGKEFHSWAFDQLLIATRTNIRYRPPHQARFGAVIERMFGTTDKRLIHNLAGNTKAMLDVRKVTSVVNPINADAPTLPQLHGLLDFFFFEQYANEVHPAIQDTPRSYMERRLTETGWRLNRNVKFDSQFMVLTCPPPIGRRTRKVDHLRGVRLGRLYYWCDEFSNPKHRNVTVELKLDPWNASLVYAKLDGKWMRCKCALFAGARLFSTVELRYMTDSLRESMRRVDREPTVADIERIVASRSLPRNASVANKDEFDIEEVYERKGMGSTCGNYSRPNATRSCPKRKPAVEPSVAQRAPKLGPNDQYPMQ